MATTNTDEVLEKLHHADWKTIQLKLLEHAMFRIRRLYWRSGNQLLPKGTTAEDLVTQAIQKTFEGARRWDPSLKPDLLDFLKSVVDSDVSHLVNSEEHRLTQYGVESPADSAAPQESPPEHLRSPEERFLRAETEKLESTNFEDFIEELHQEFKDDREVTLLLQSFREQSERNENIKPGTVARETGLPISDVRNAIKRLRRKILCQDRTPGMPSLTSSVAKARSARTSSGRS